MLPPRISSSVFGAGSIMATGVVSKTLLLPHRQPRSTPAALALEDLALLWMVSPRGRRYAHTSAAAQATKIQSSALEDNPANTPRSAQAESGTTSGTHTFCQHSTTSPPSSWPPLTTALVISNDSTISIHQHAASSSAATSPASVTKPEPPKTDGRKIVFHSWDSQMDALIVRLNQDYHIHWRTIGLVIDRPFTTCYSRFLTTLRPALERGWVPPEIEDRELLNRLVQEAKIIEQSKKIEADSRNAAKKTEAALATEPEGPKRVRWDQTTDQAIMEMVDAGKSWPTIGLAVNRPYASCYSRYYRALDPVLKEPWSPDVVRQIDEWVGQGVCWKKIAKDLNMRPTSCKAKWMFLSRFDTSSESRPPDTSTKGEPAAVVTKSKSKVRWIAFSKEESESILKLVEQHGPDNWDQVLEDFQMRCLRSSSPGTKPSKANQRIRDVTTSMLRHQHSRLVRNNLHWTLDQETMLIQQVIQHNTEGYWDKIAQTIGTHSPQECRSHWKQLDMPVNSIPVQWGKTEQSTFWMLWQEFGSNFERLSKLCGGQHSAADCQRYFENMTQEFPDPEEHPEEFKRCMEKLLATLPTASQKFIFTKTRSVRLQRAMRCLRRRQDGRMIVVRGTWGWVADRVQRGLSTSACMEHWAYLQKNMDVLYGPLEQGKSVIKPEYSSSWSHEELKLLDQGVRELGSSWGDIQQKFLPWRTTRSLRQRWLLMSDKSTKVTGDEYYIIVAAGGKSSEIDYDALAHKMSGWNRSPCQRVFETSYKHLLATSVWLPEEDQLLIKKTLEMRGRDWEAIAGHFDGVQAARAPLFTESMARIGPDDGPPLRTHKTAWQCRLRWCQLLAPLMPAARVGPSSQRSVALKLSKQLLKEHAHCHHDRPYLDPDCS